MSKKQKAEPLKQPDVVCSAVTLRKILMKLETDYGWSIYKDGEARLTQMQKELIIDVAKATKDLLT